MHPLQQHPLRHLFMVPGGRSRRASSWDRTGGNRDFMVVGPGETAVLLEHDGPGCITHLYCALAFPEITDYRDAILRCFWDGEATPSVEVPLGDFFTLAHARVRLLHSHFVTVNPGFGASHGLNAYFPMPFAGGARVILTHRGDRLLGGLFPALWYHIEYETYEAPPPPETLRFHAQWRQQTPTTAVGDQPNVQLHDAVNLDGQHNYVALEAAGAGQMVGLLLEINNRAGGWYGEGDDMVFLDGERWPPSIHGTGTEEIFGAGACPATEFSGPYQGFHLIESADYCGLVGAYRWYVHDPIRFTRSLRWTVEHGHANNFANDYASVAYWYQTEPHAAFPPLPSRDALRPPLAPPYEEARDAFVAAFTAAPGGAPTAGPFVPRRSHRREVLCGALRGDADPPQVLLGVSIRAGLHTGEIERRADDIGGIGMHIAPRLADMAGSSEGLVSRTTRDLAVGSKIQFDDRGMHTLKGVPEPWQVFAARC